MEGLASVAPRAWGIAKELPDVLSEIVNEIPAAWWRRSDYVEHVLDALEQRLVDRERTWIGDSVAHRARFFTRLIGTAWDRLGNGILFARSIASNVLNSFGPPRSLISSSEISFRIASRRTPIA
jgi:hypothetical protein